MSCLKSLSLTLKEDYVLNPWGPSRGDDDTTAIGEKHFTSFVTRCCPNLKQLEIRGLDNLQEKVFRRMRRSGSSFGKLESLALAVKEVTIRAFMRHRNAFQ